MSTGTHHRLTSTGFILLYLAGMGSLFTISSPDFESVGRDFMVYVLLPVAVSGAALTACAWMSDIDRSDPG